MLQLYAFDKYKNKVAFFGDTGTPITVPMQLSDGSILFYDRGSNYGEYSAVRNDIVRISDGVDDGSAESQNWRYLICDQKDPASSSKQWGPYGTNENLIAVAIGAGLPNTNVMINKYADNDTYWWKLIKEKRDNTGLDWFMPSLNELDILYDNRHVISSEGGTSLSSAFYWSSSEVNNNTAWYLDFSLGGKGNVNKNTTRRCRLLRRI